MSSCADSDVDCGDTLPFDNELSPSSFSGGKYDAGDDNKWQYFEDTLPLDDDDDDDLVIDALETQPDLAGETQVLSIAGETQVLDEIGFDDDINTQILDVIDEEVPIDAHGDRMDGTEPQCIDNTQSESPKEISCEPPCGPGDKKLSEKTDDVSDQHINSGSRPPRFTFLRVESLREAALSARSMDLKQTKGMNQSQQPVSVKDNGGLFLGCTEKTTEVDLEYNHGEYTREVNVGFNENKSKVASSAVRKLFSDDLPVENEDNTLNSNDVNGGEDLTKLSINNDELPGLSYVNSQEPGELSQASALDFVDRLLKDNIMEFDQQVNTLKSKEDAVENSRSHTSLKGQLSMARRAAGSGKTGNTGIYDWDDSCEDEGGGGIFLRRKDEFLDGEICGRKSLPGAQKVKANRMGGKYRNGKGKLSLPNKRVSAIDSGSRLMLQNLVVRDGTVKEAVKKFRRNLVKDLDGQLEPCVTAANAQGLLDVGLDTQMAAEAMEALGNCEGIDNHVANEATRSSLTDEPNDSSAGTTKAITSKKCSRQYNKNSKVDGKSDLQNSSISKTCNKEAREHIKKGKRLKRLKRSALYVEDNLISTAGEKSGELPSQVIEQRKSTRVSERFKGDTSNNCTGSERGKGACLVSKMHLQSQVYQFTPVAYRTRRSSAANQLAKPDRSSSDLGEEDRSVGSLEKRNNSAGIHSSKASDPNSALSCSDYFGVDENTKLSRLNKKPSSKLSLVNNVTVRDISVCTRRRSLRKLSNHDVGQEELASSSNPSVHSDDIGSSAARKRKTRPDTRSVVRSRLNSGPAISCETPTIVDKSANSNSEGTNAATVQVSGRSSEVIGSDESPREGVESFKAASATPNNCKTSANDASPLCMGNDYYKQSCNSELRRELHSLSDAGHEFTTPSKDSRKRRDMTDVRILYSQHLDKDIIKHQKKILSRLGVSVATSIMDATHFIADEFMRTRNMLEAIASGKPVVTHLWIESCGQTNYVIDEKNYILRDSKKEKEFGFSMPVSLTRATQYPLLEGRRVLITPNIKPSKEIVSRLVKAVQGQAIERICRSSLKDDKNQDELLILSCEEDYASCVPFLEKGAAVYSSELLLNGIVTQKLEYERHRLFADHVKKTRSTLWLKGDGGKFHPVTQCK